MSLGVRDRLNMVYVETSRHHSVLNSRLSDVGLSYPIVATAIGRAYLCGCTPAERQSLINEVRVKTPEQWERHGATVLQNIEEFPKLGFCRSHGDLQSDVFSVGVPLRRQSNGLLVAANCVVHSFQASAEQLEENIGPRLVALGRALDHSIALI